MYMDLNLLIVEDNSEINGLLWEALTAEGYKCTSAYSGSEALLQLGKSHFDLIILDLMLPGVSGTQIIKISKSRFATPIIVLTAKDEIESKVDVLLLGADDYITKPFNIKELIARVTVQMRKSNKSKDGLQMLKYKNLIVSVKSAVTPSKA